jgi:hypothetical protein
MLMGYFFAIVGGAKVVDIPVVFFSNSSVPARKPAGDKIHTNIGPMTRIASVLARGCLFRSWHIASFRCHAAFQSLSERSGH